MVDEMMFCSTEKEVHGLMNELIEEAVYVRGRGGEDGDVRTPDLCPVSIQ